jgi:hypothetical protein
MFPLRFSLPPPPHPSSSSPYFLLSFSFSSFFFFFLLSSSSFPSSQHRFSNSVLIIKRQSFLTEAVLISFGSVNSSPKTLNADESTQQIIRCTVSVSINRPIIYRCLLTGACAVRIGTTISSWCLLNLSRSSTLFLHSHYLSFFNIHLHYTASSSFSKSISYSL